MLLRILAAIDAHYGRLDGVELGTTTPNDGHGHFELMFSNRMAIAISVLIVDPELEFSSADFARLLLYHDWIDLIFSLSAARTSDHLIPKLAKIANGRLSFETSNVLRLLATRSMNSAIDVNFDEYLRVSAGSLLAFLFYTGSAYGFWSRGFEFRERLLEWLPGRLDTLKLGEPSLARLHDIYMHCSYAVTPKKHAIKADLMKLMRRACLESGCPDVSARLPDAIPDRPTIIVVAEQFFRGHSIYRTHSRAVASLRERFNVVGLFPLSSNGALDEYFDECIPIPAADFLSCVRRLASEIAKRKPVLIFYLGVGMAPHVIALASMRLAPIQCVSFGHTATTMSEAMDYFVLPDDFAGAPGTFSEKLLTLPKAAMPFVAAPPGAVTLPPPDGTIRIAVPASIMKLNPRLFRALARIVGDARSRTEIHFFPLLASGLPYYELSRAVQACLPNAVVFPEAPQDLYFERLARCDLFVSPFPYGNMNSIIDAFSLGIPGVCLDGPETHSHADVALFARLGLPETLCAKTIDDYVAATVRLIDDRDWREACRKIVRDADLDAAFFRGDARLFCDAIANLIWPKAEAI